MMLKSRYLFPAVYTIFLLPFVLDSSLILKALFLITYVCLACVINIRSITGFLILFLIAQSTFAPFLVLVQSAMCSSSSMQFLSSAFTRCVVHESLAVQINVSSLYAVFILAVANEWRGSLVLTMNSMNLPRTVRTIAIVSGAMIGEFRRAVFRVHHAFTARGDAMPSVSWRNVIVLPVMLGTIWSSVLSGVVDRVNGQWSSDSFWARYVPAKRRPRVESKLTDLA